MLLNKISSLGSTVKSLCLFWAKRWEDRFLCFPFGQIQSRLSDTQCAASSDAGPGKRTGPVRARSRDPFHTRAPDWKLDKRYPYITVASFPLLAGEVGALFQILILLICATQDGVRVPRRTEVVNRNCMKNSGNSTKNRVIS